MIEKQTQKEEEHFEQDTSTRIVWTAPISSLNDCDVVSLPTILRLTNTPASRLHQPPLATPNNLKASPTTIGHATHYLDPHSLACIVTSIQGSSHPRCLRHVRFCLPTRYTIDDDSLTPRYGSLGMRGGLVERGTASTR
jgi:hypothetical protein